MTVHKLYMWTVTVSIVLGNISMLLALLVKVMMRGDLLRLPIHVMTQIDSVLTNPTLRYLVSTVWGHVRYRIKNNRSLCLQNIY